jgi:DNA (cytosine-5)-methyltransferase 1
MRLLGLFCGAGGAAVGYARAGFTVVGVDLKAQPRYPYEFHQGDALEFLAAHGHEFDAIHASPPCQAYVRSGMVAKDGRHPKLIEPVRDALIETGLPFVIENVPGAPLRTTIMLCGSMFGLPIRRHRLFEIHPARLDLVPPCDHSKPITGIYGHPHGKGGAWRNGKRPMLPSDAATWARGLGVDWMEPREMALAIPPAYTEWVGKRLLAVTSQASPS